jgi:hypothetical protein
MTARRDLERERLFFRKAAMLAPPFREHARERLEAGDREYGDSWATRGLADLLFEIAEECVDVAAWAVLTDQALDERTDLEPVDRDFARKALRDAARYGAFAYARVFNARLRLPEIDEGDYGR